MNEAWLLSLLDQPVVWILGGMASVAILLYLAQSVLVLIGGTVIGLFFYQRYKQTPRKDNLSDTLLNTLKGEFSQRTSLKESMINLQTPSQKLWSDQFKSILDT